MTDSKQQPNVNDAYQFQAETEDLVEKQQDQDAQNEAEAEVDIVAKLEAKAVAAEEKAKIALADYQNLMRRTQEERIAFIQNASREMAAALIMPLQNLDLAAKALNDRGLNMVIDQFWQALNEQGLEEIGDDLIGKKFDVETMEAVEKDGKGEKVKKIISPGYQMNGKVIQHAKVLVG